MPREGYKSITIKDTMYEYFEQIYKENSFQLNRMGINSFSGFTVWLMSSIVDEKQLSMLEFAKGVLKLPQEVTQ